MNTKKKIIKVFQSYRLLSISGLLLFLVSCFLFLFFSRDQGLGTRDQAPTLRAGSGTTLFTTGNKTFQADLGTTTGEPRINFKVNQVESSYTLNGVQNVTPKKIDARTLLYENIQPGTDLKYTTLENGIKEEIILRQAVTTNKWLFDLNLKGTNPEKIFNDNISPTFTDATGHYAFHFEKPFAIDAAGDRTNSVLMQIEPNPKSPDAYQIQLIVDQAWLQDPKRVYPISIDPTVVHDTTSEFATGQLNRTTDAGSESAPSLESYYQELPADSHTIGLWHFNETSGNALDSSGNSNTFTATGTIISTGILNNARVFGGTSSDFLSINSSFSKPPAITTEAWFKTAATVRQGIIGQSNTAPTVVATAYTPTILIQADGKIRGEYYTGSAAEITSSAAYNDNRWHHVALITDGSTQTMFVDGNLVGSRTGTTSLSWWTVTTIGAGYDSINRGGTAGWVYFNGSIDEVRISNIARTPEEIRMNASRRPSGTYTSDVISTTDPVSSWNSFTWNGQGIATGDGETATSSATAALVAQWNFNETSGTSVVSGGSCGTSCNGTLTNFASTGSQDAAAGTGWTSANKRWGAGALMFDGTNDHVSIGDNNSLSFTNKVYSFEAWINTNSQGVMQTIFSKGGTSNWEYEFRINTSNVLYFILHNAAGTAGTATTGNTIVTDGKWHHVVATGDGITQRVYLDGIIHASTAFTADAETNGTANLAIGARNTAAYPFNGGIDSPKIYNRALTPAEILSNYNSSRLEIQTRVGSSTDPNDGTWEDWKPSTTETTINSMDNPVDWATPSATIWTGGAQIATSAATLPIAEGTKSLKIQTGQNTSLTDVVGMWHLDETGGTGAYLKDVSDTANHITPTGTTLVEGISGKARSFNGSSDYATINRPIQDDFTIEFWMNTTQVGADSTNWYSCTGLIDGEVGDVVNDFGTTLCGSKLGFGIGNSDITIKSSTSVNDGKWHHVAFTRTRSSGNFKIYLDGIQENSGTGNTNSLTAPPNLTIAKSRGNVYYFNGKIDEIRISNVTRTADEIAEAYRMGRDHRISETIPSTDLSSATKIPFSIASDRLGTFMQMTYGESAYANYEPDANTVGLWHLDEQTGAGAYLKDASGNGSHGTPTGTTFTQGKIGKARSLSGSGQYLTIPNNSALNPTSAITIETWINPSGTNSNNGIIFKGSLSSTQGIYSLLLQGVPIFRLNGSISEGSGQATGKTTLVTGQWYHVAAVYSVSSGKQKIYVNGVEEISQSYSTAISTDANNVTVGCYYSTGYCVNGVVDEVRISNVARTAEEIRQAYEVGARTHDITIDFKAKLESGNLITGSDDLGFTVDETAYGSYTAAGHLYLGDKIIVRENYDGTEYIAQGTVNAVNASTGAVTVTAWDSGSTFPSGGYTVNATVFKWQKEYFDLTGSLSTHRDAITRLTYSITDGSLGSTVWLDDLHSSTGYLNSPTGSTILSSLRKNYFQYRTILTSTDPAVSSSFSSVSLDYTTSTQAPTTPTLAQPTNGLSLVDQPTFSLSATDSDGDYLRYRIQICTDVAMTENCQTFDQTSTQTGWSGQDAQTNTAYASGTTATYTLQTPLDLPAQYYWTGSVIDPEDTNQWVTTTPYNFFLGSILRVSTACVTQFAGNQVTVSWQDQSTYEEGNHLEKKTNAGAWTALPDQAAESVSYLDSVISAGSTYQYRVAPYKSSVAAAWCETATVSIPNPAANPVTMDGVSMSGINLD